MRLFVAAWPPPELLDRLVALPRPVLRRGRWTTRDQWHVTLRFLGHVDDPAPVVAALRQASLPAATARVGPAVVRLGREVACLPVEGLDALAAAVERATAGLGRPPERRGFRGHLTLARVRGGVPPAVLGVPFEASFGVGSVAVVRSELHPDGARYEVLARIPCTGA